MANISTITYNGKVIAETEEPGNVAVIYDGKTIADIGAGETKTFACADKIMKTNLYIGAKTLLCEMSKMISDVIVAVKSAFPASPSSYTLIGTYTSSQTWTAPEDGYFQIEVFGASGSGGSSLFIADGRFRTCTGGGGGGGGYACSRVKLNKGDTIAITRSTTCKAIINSSLETYSTMSVTNGNEGGAGNIVESYPKQYNYGTGGAGGVASGGNYANKNGGKGKNGSYLTHNASSSGSVNASGGAGGAAGYTDGNKGGAGANVRKGVAGTAGAGSAGFIKIYRGNTNIA